MSADKVRRVSSDKPAGPTVEMRQEPREPDGAYNSADDRAVNNAKRAEARQRRQDADVLRHVMRTPEGRDWLYRKLASCHIYEGVADLGGTYRNADTHVTYFRDGERNVGNLLLQDAMRASTDLYVTMVKEQEEKRRAHANALEQQVRREDPDRALAEDTTQGLSVTAPKGYPQTRQ